MKNTKIPRYRNVLKYTLIASIPLLAGAECGSETVERVAASCSATELTEFDELVVPISGPYAVTLSNDGPEQNTSLFVASGGQTGGGLISRFELNGPLVDMDFQPAEGVAATTILAADFVPPGDFNEFNDLLYGTGAGGTGATVGFFQNNNQVFESNKAYRPYTNREISNEVVSVADIHAAELNGDQFQDVLVASSQVQLSGSTITWYQNDGTGNFGDPKVIATANGSTDRYSTVTAGDLNGDGFSDVISGSDSRNTINWYKNDGEGNFTLQLPVDNFASGVSSVQTADMNDNGLVDVVAALSASNTIAWYKNDGVNSFTKTIISTDVSNPREVVAVDFDGDNKLDVVSASDTGGPVVWYKNLGNGVFSDAIAISSRDLAVRDIAVGFIDSDSLLDVVVATPGADEVVVFRTVCKPKPEVPVTTGGTGATGAGSTGG